MEQLLRVSRPREKEVLDLIEVSLRYSLLAKLPKAEFIILVTWRWHLLNHLIDLQTNHKTAFISAFLTDGSKKSESMLHAASSINCTILDTQFFTEK